MAPEMIRLWANPELDVKVKEKKRKKQNVSEQEMAKCYT
jgi:hypothetical protein